MRHAGRIVIALSLLCIAAPAAAQTTLRAQQGEGIWSLLRRGGISPTTVTIEAFKNLNQERLLRGDQLAAGRAYTLPEPNRPVEVFPLLGSRHERVERKTDRLAGHVYYLVSGHGGPDPGTMARYRGAYLPEDEVAYDVALRLARRLLEEGATVHLIVQDPDDGIREGARLPPDTDERYLGGHPIVRSHAQRLRDRVAIVNRLYDRHRATAERQRLLALHVDARDMRDEPQIDVHFQVASDAGKRFAEGLLSTFRQQYARVQPGRGYRGSVEFRDLYILLRSKPVAALVELGNIRHPRDQRRLTRTGNRQALAEWLVRGLLRDAAATGGGSGG